MRRAWLAVAIVIAVAGCGSSTSKSSQTSTAAGSATSAAAGSAAPAGCRTVPVPPPKGPQHIPPPKLKLDPNRTYTITVVTNCGTFAFNLDVKQSPKTSASIDYLVKRGFYNGLTFHRVAQGFVIQGGDPIGDVAMAKTESEPPGASGSQFFVVTGANVTQSAGLTPDYALAGKVISGIGVVEKIGSLPTTPPGDGMPSPSVVMSSVTVASH